MTGKIVPDGGKQGFPDRFGNAKSRPDHEDPGGFEIRKQTGSAYA